METYIARQPILNRERKLQAYEVIYRQDSSSLYNQSDKSVATAIISFFSGIDSSNFLSGKEAFLTFTPNLLIQDVPHMFDKDKLVIQIEDNVLVYSEALRIINSYKAHGFRLALLDFEFHKRYLDILPMIDIMKIDFSEPENPDILVKLRIARQYGIQVIGYNVNTAQALEKAFECGVDGFQGSNVADMVRSEVRKVEHLQSNFFRLMAAISKEIPDFDEIAGIIALDVTLTFSLIRMVNSAYFALPNRVKDIKQALTVLGMGQLRHWIYLLSFSSDNGGMSDELIKTSFLRATFCQELSQFVKGLPVSHSDAYLMGMFSTLDVLLQVEMEDALRELPLNEHVKSALTTGDGMCGTLLKLCTCYEKGEWSNVEVCSKALDLPMNTVGQKYLEAVEYVNETWSDLIQPFSGNR